MTPQKEPLHPQAPAAQSVTQLVAQLAHIQKVLIIGSGPIVIGQACEFDYAGSQSVRALKKRGKEVTLINSNPATIMTDYELADHVYLKPLTKESVIEILEKHEIDAVLPTMGGQTSLNLTIQCEEANIWEDYGVQIIGVDVASIQMAEDRDKFRKKMKELDIPVCEGTVASSLLQAKQSVQSMKFPVIIRPSYTLGGTGGSIVHKEEDFAARINEGLHASPIHEVLVEESIYGWKEYELEMLRDHYGNTVVICCIENVDPLGIHTGDSITVTPAMTLSDVTYQIMRDMAKKVMGALNCFAGGCNVQFAVNPKNDDIVVIEINPRVSRSSALASKATGYPIAGVATQLALGDRLDEITNQITGNTSAFFEPSIDYVVVKIPRWNFDKFYGSDQQLGFQMKSVGEVMGIGRSFQEALLKAYYSLEINIHPLLYYQDNLSEDKVREKLSKPSWDRSFYLFHAYRIGLSTATIHKLTLIDNWYLEEIADWVCTEKKVRACQKTAISSELLKEAKSKGFSDEYISILTHKSTEEIVACYQTHGLTRHYKQVDTCAAEFQAQTPYYYSTMLHSRENESVPVQRNKKIMIIGAGPNRIGQGIEFDYCCVHGVLAAKAAGFYTIMVNCNPETVSTDFDISDKLYFEPIHWEYVKSIIDLEQPEGVIVQLSGQTSLKLAKNLYDYKVPIIGTSFHDMNQAEDRIYFSDLLKKHDIPYPPYGIADDTQESIKLGSTLGFPVLVRPSYVLGGQDMKIVINEEELEQHVVRLLRKMPDNRIMIDKFIDNAIEAELDAICDGEEVHIIGIMEHVEPAGIHSGDSYAVLPPYSLEDSIITQMKSHTTVLAKVLKIKGFINIQFAIKDGVVYVIEANPRASRTVPFICKAHQIPYVQYATQIMLGTHKLKDFVIKPRFTGYAIKEPIFSFNKFPSVNKELGPEMKSTGENIYFIDSLKDEYFTKICAERNLYLSR